MTARAYPGGPKLPIVTCEHRVEAHVIFVNSRQKYLGVIRCACYKLIRYARELRDRFVEAQQDAVQLLRVKFPPETPNVNSSPTPEQINQAWLVWWRRLCAKRNHRSRL